MHPSFCMRKCGNSSHSSCRYLFFQTIDFHDEILHFHGSYIFILLIQSKAEGLLKNINSNRRTINEKCLTSSKRIVFCSFSGLVHHHIHQAKHYTVHINDKSFFLHNSAGWASVLASHQNKVILVYALWRLLLYSHALSKLDVHGIVLQYYKQRPGRRVGPSSPHLNRQDYLKHSPVLGSDMRVVP